MLTVDVDLFKINIQPMCPYMFMLGRARGEVPLLNKALIFSGGT